MRADAIEQAQMNGYVLQKKQERQQAYRNLLIKAYHVDEASLRTMLTSKISAERFAAAYVTGERQLSWQTELIERLRDPNVTVREASRRSLVILSFFALQGMEQNSPSAGDAPAGKPAVVDFGPAPEASKSAQDEAAQKWTAWWSEHGVVGRTNGAELRSAGPDADLDAEAARLGAALVFAEPARQAEQLARYRDAKGIVYTEALANALQQLDGETRRTGREFLAERLSRMTAATLRDRLSDPRAELRRAAALARAMKNDRTAIPEIIPLLSDPEDLVVRGAKAALKSLSGKDFGPTNGATATERAASIKDWQTWWAKQKQ
jgi:hypothetical protein